MIAIYHDHQGEKTLSRGVTQCLMDHIRLYGPITCLDRWAIDWGITPWYVRRCAHRAAAQGLLKLTRLEDKPGHPYKVELTCLEETHEN